MPTCVVLPSAFLASLAVVAGLAGPGFASPVEDLLRVAPPDAAFLLVVQDARGHVARLRESPFAASYGDAILSGKRLDLRDLHRFRRAVQTICEQAGTTPQAVLDDVVGDAIVFAFQPGKTAERKDERGLLLIHPARPETLTRIIDRINQLQLNSGELQAVEKREHKKAAYSERMRSSGKSEFYCLRDSVFAFSLAEPEIRGFIERGQATPFPKIQRPAAAETIEGLALGKAAAVLLVNPRALDAEMQAKASLARAEEKPLLNRVKDFWTNLEAVALYLDLGKDLEIGLALRMREGTKAILGPDAIVASRLWSSIPDDALVAVAGRQKVSELVDWVGRLMPAQGRQAIRGAVEQTLAPVIGRDKLPLVIDSLGPDWGLWALPPRDKAGFLPVPVFALEVRAEGENGPQAAKALLGAVDYAFQTIRVMYNATHLDQIDIIETPDQTITIKSLKGEKAFPPLVRPSFALKDGFLLLAGDPDAIKNVRKPMAAVESGAEVPLFRLSAASLRTYLTRHAAPLSRFLAERTGLTPEDAARQIREAAEALEPFERLEVFARPNGQTVHLAARLKLAKPLAK